MQLLRAYSRLLLLLIATPLIFSLFLPSLFLKLFGINNDAWRNKILGLWAKTCAIIIGMRISTNGSIPKSPFILVSNHLSYTDIFVLLSVVDGVLIAKNEVRSWPIMGWMMEVIGIIFIDRNSRTDVKRVNKQIEDNLRPKQGIIFFPEATTSDGADILPFKASLLAYPAKENYPVNYASISYITTEPKKSERDYIHWWGDMTFFTHLLELLSMQKFYASVTFGESQIIDSDRKKLANRLYDQVRLQYLNLNE